MKIEKEMSQAVQDGVFPGAALLVGRKDKIVYRGFFGSATLMPKPEPVTEETIFDIASLTKPVATASLTHELIQEKGLSLNHRVGEKFSIRHLLDHTSGLPAWRPYFEEAGKLKILKNREKTRQYYWKKILDEPLEDKLGTRRIYSDLGFILLGIWLEDLSGESLESLFKKKVAEPLELKNTFYVPLGVRGGESGFPPRVEPKHPAMPVRGGLEARGPRPDNKFAATEDSAWRGHLIRGEVHDDNAYALGGVAGHAGLFSTVDDLHRFLLSVRDRHLEEKFDGLGWDRPTPNDSQAGQFLSKNSFGHLGYSGCSFWVDLEQDFHVILLTNRVHPSSKNERIKSFRPKIHDLIFEELIRNLSFYCGGVGV